MQYAKLVAILVMNENSKFVVLMAVCSLSGYLSYKDLLYNVLRLFMFATFVVSDLELVYFL